MTDTERRTVKQMQAMSVVALREWVDKRPRDAAAHYALSKKLREGGDMAKALVHALSAVEFGKARPLYYENALKILIGLRLLRCSELIGTDAINKGVADARIYYQVGLALKRAKRGDAAVKYLDYAIHLNPKSEMYRRVRNKW